MRNRAEWPASTAAWAIFLAIMVLPKPIAAAQISVAGAGEEVQGEGAFDQGAVDFLGPVPFEIGQGFEAAEAGLREAAFQAAAGEVLGFGTGDFFQQLTRDSSAESRRGPAGRPGIRR